MKKIIALCLSVIYTVCMQAQEIKFNVTEHDFGNVPYQDSAVFHFEFTNTGDAPLLISRVASTCGCTVPTYSTEPVPPKGKGKVTVQYLYTDRLVAFSKQVTVVSNAQKNSIVNLTIKGVVVGDNTTVGDPKAVTEKVPAAKKKTLKSSNSK